MVENLRKLMDDIKDLAMRIYKWFRSPVFRVYVLKIIAVGLSFMLVVSIYMVQVIHAEDYRAFQSITTTANLNREVPRGVIYDRNGVPLVTNEAISVITYRHIPNTYIGEMRRVARELTSLIEFDYSDVLTVRDKQDLFIFLHPGYARDLVPIEERSTDNAVFNAQMIERIEDEHLEMLTEAELNAHAIFMRMYQGAGRTTNIIKENPTEEEIARITERLMYLPGIDIGIDWSRQYPSELSRDFFGTVSTQQQGIPRDREAYFLSQGYAPNARVGTSQLERTLQTYLSGFEYRYFIEDGIPTLLSEGLPGFEVSLNLDSELQLIVEEIVANHLLEQREDFRSRYLERAYVVLSVPDTGAVLAMVAVVIDENGEAIMNPLATFQSATLVGSTVKGASLATGYANGVTVIGQQREDNVLRFQGTPPLSSHMPMGWLTDLRAIYQSSNVYFFRQAMEMAGVFSDSPNAPIPFWDSNAFDLHLDMFNQFGLGSHTGIEYQHENHGFHGGRGFGELLRFAIGQEDSYTAMQIAQFAATVATRGSRFQMQIVQNIYMPGGNSEARQLIRAFEPNLLNQIELTEQQWDTIQDGHRRTVTIRYRGTAESLFQGVNFNPAGKTGTAEDFLRNPINGHIIMDEHGNAVQILNHTFMGYAPYNNPEIAIGVIVPAAQVYGTRNVESQAVIIARAVMQAYFDLQIERSLERENYENVDYENAEYENGEDEGGE